MTGYVAGTEILLFLASIICPAYQVKWLSSSVYLKWENKAERSDVWIFWFFALQSSATVEKQAVFVIMSTNILDSLENIKLRKVTRTNKPRTKDQ